MSGEHQGAPAGAAGSGGGEAGVRVREAIPADAERLGQMMAGIIRDHGEVPPAHAILVDGVRRILRLAHAGFLLAEAAGEPVGMVQITERFSTWRVRPFFYLDDFYVEPAWRSRGVGAALLAAVVARARAAGCVRIDLDVFPGNTGALAFYLRHGFQDTQEHLLRLDLDALDPSG